MKTRTIEEIEQAFREIGLTEKTWGQQAAPETDVDVEPSPTEQVFIRIETTTKPLEIKVDADLA